MDYIKPEILKPDYFKHWIPLYNFNYSAFPENFWVGFKLMDDPPKPLPKYELDARYKKAKEIIAKEIDKTIADRIINSVQPVLVSTQKWSKEEIKLIFLKISLIQAKYNKADKRKIKSLKIKIKRLNKRLSNESKNI